MVVAYAICLATLTFWVLGRQPIWNVNYEQLSGYDIPSDDEWEEILIEHSDEIFDGSRDPNVLNDQFVHGWQICVRDFLYNRPTLFPWDYDWILQNNPGQYLGGPMKDTIRVSRSEGRKRASDVIKTHLATQSEIELRNSFYSINNNYLGLLVGYTIFIGTGILWFRKRRITMR